VNYGGSSGYGRAYRDRLRGAWGIVDVADTVAAARAAVERGLANERRLVVRGTSAGGFTACHALVGESAFAAGASYFGVLDLERLAAEMHKFEAHYLEWLVGASPRDHAAYRERSPLHVADRIARPLLVFQGLADRVVPPSQAEAMVAHLRGRGLPFAYVTFEGEGHGFRRADTIARCLESEYAFYCRILGLEPRTPLRPLEIENLTGGGA
jgi:dipeptidyl aminopeptidase/acylaminoacyl peptidase